MDGELFTKLYLEYLYEKEENPFKKSRKTPFNKLPLIRNIPFSDNIAFPSINLEPIFIGDIDIIDYDLLAEESYYSNLIEGIELDDGSLKHCQDYLISTPAPGLKDLLQLSKFINGDDFSLRKRGIRRCCIASNGRVIYTPPDSGAKIKELLSDLFSVEYQRLSSSMEGIALFHYQFESIHPFWDGNGRIGRLIMYFQLHRLTGKQISVSKEIYRTRKEYYNALSLPRLKDDYSSMIEYFLRCFSEKI